MRKCIKCGTMFEKRCKACAAAYKRAERLDPAKRAKHVALSIKSQAKALAIPERRAKHNALCVQYHKTGARGYNALRSEPLAVLKHRVRARLHCALKRKGFGKNSSLLSILGCSFESFQQYISAQFQDGMTWDNFGAWHIDHIKPLVIASTEDEVLRLSHYTNMQPLWARDNLIKGARTT